MSEGTKDKPTKIKSVLNAKAKKRTQDDDLDTEAELSLDKLKALGYVRENGRRNREGSNQSSQDNQH